MAEKDKLTHVPAVSVDKIIEMLSDAYCSIIEGGLPVTAMPSVMLWGAPGVGKSQAVRQIADEIGERTGKKVKVTDVRLLLFNPIDLRGIPTANADRTLSVWLKPKIFDMDERKGVVNILFLDEISAAPPSVQAAAYQITLDRVIGEHRLPDNCIVIAAGNRITDNSVAFKMPKALANRLLQLDVEGNFESWKKWAVRRGINAKVTGFLSFRRDMLSRFEGAGEDLAFATPRSWEMVSNVLNFVQPDADKAFPLIAGLVGTGVAVEFRSWCNVFSQLPDIEEVFNGRCRTVPKGTDVLYALVSSMTVYAREHRDDMKRIANSISYANLLPPDFSAVLLKDYMYLEKDYRLKLMKLPEFLKWFNEKGRLLNGVV